MLIVRWKSYRENILVCLDHKMNLHFINNHFINNHFINNHFINNHFINSHNDTPYLLISHCVTSLNNAPFYDILLMIFF